MKKSLLVLAALAALSMAFVSCGGGAGGGDSKPVNDDGPKAKVLTFSNVYGKVIWNVADDWTTFAVEFDGVPTAVQFCAEGDQTSSENQLWGDMYYVDCDSASLSVNFADALTALQGKGHNDTKVTKAILGAKNDAAATAKIKSITVTKADGSKIEFPTPDALDNGALN